jgi:hypothetical protein
MKNDFDSATALHGSAALSPENSPSGDEDATRSNMRQVREPRCSINGE